MRHLESTWSYAATEPVEIIMIHTDNFLQYYCWYLTWSSFSSWLSSSTSASSCSSASSAPSSSLSSSAVFLCFSLFFFSVSSCGSGSKFNVKKLYASSAVGMPFSAYICKESINKYDNNKSFVVKMIVILFPALLVFLLLGTWPWCWGPDGHHVFHLCLDQPVKHWGVKPPLLDWITCVQ